MKTLLDPMDCTGDAWAAIEGSQKELMLNGSRRTMLRVVVQRSGCLQNHCLPLASIYSSKSSFCLGHIGNYFRCGKICFWASRKNMKPPIPGPLNLVHQPQTCFNKFGIPYPKPPGIPLGLGQILPLVLKDRGASYTELGVFSLQSWPFVLKLLRLALHGLCLLCLAVLSFALFSAWQKGLPLCLCLVLVCVDQLFSLVGGVPPKYAEEHTTSMYAFFWFGGSVPFEQSNICFNMSGALPLLGGSDAVGPAPGDVNSWPLTKPKGLAGASKPTRNFNSEADSCLFLFFGPVPFERTSKPPNRCVFVFASVRGLVPMTGKVRWAPLVDSLYAPRLQCWAIFRRQLFLSFISESSTLSTWEKHIRSSALSQRPKSVKPAEIRQVLYLDHSKILCLFSSASCIWEHLSAFAGRPTFLAMKKFGLGFLSDRLRQIRQFDRAFFGLVKRTRHQGSRPTVSLSKNPAQIRSIGRRKTWMVPAQLIIGLLLLFTAAQLDLLLGDECLKQTPSEVLNSTIYFGVVLVLCLFVFVLVHVHPCSVFFPLDPKGAQRCQTFQGPTRRQCIASPACSCS